MFNIIKEFFVFLLTKKKYYLIPIAVIMIIFGIILVTSQGSVFAPFIYTFF